MKGLYCFDIEANGLLDDSTVDYTTSPWSLKDFKIHCIVIENLETGEQTSFVGEECKNFKQFVIDNVEAIIAHNGINYDLTVLKAVYGMDFTLGFEETPSTWCGKDVRIIDTFIMSKTIYPDRQSHSLDYLGTLCGVHKIDWRSEAISLGLIEHSSPKGAEFAVYHPQMLEYNKQDVKTNIAVFKYLFKEMGDWDWNDALELEHYVAWIITRQAHRGFWFDQELALKNVQELDELMAKHKTIVEPHLPEKPLTKTKLKEWTPPATQFLKSGLPNTHIKNFAAKVGGQLVEYSDGWYFEWEGQIFKLPFSEPLKKTEPTSISDSTFIKEFLVGLGWQPSEFKEKDLTLDTKKKKLSPEKFEATVRRYVEQTLASNFLPFRMERVKCTDSRKLMRQLLSHDLSKPLKVLTNPTFTVGQEKNIDPALSELESTFPYVKNIVEYLTYNHRRNSILGGGVDWEDADEEGETGFLPNVRKDGRIPTPADSMGAATARMKHKIVANVPRVTSLYGEPIRRLFGVGKGNGAIQFAYDFCSLEAMVEAHFCWQFDDENKSYCNSLILEKPNDVHTKTAEMISKMLDIDFKRGSAKSVKYACAYGAQPPKVAKTVGCDLKTGESIFNAYWEAAKPLAKFKEWLTNFWKTKGQKKFIVGIDGRQIRTRSQHSLVNAAFQSAGVIAAKRTMVYQDILFRKHGISVDFWSEDWKNKAYIQQMIAYHK